MVPLDSFLREFVEMFYQYQEPQIVDARAIAQSFGLVPTPVEQAIRNTIRCYQAQAAVSSPSYQECGQNVVAVV